jgi:hypothetical protein
MPGKCERRTLRTVTPQNVAALVGLTLIGAFLPEVRVESRVFDIIPCREFTTLILSDLRPVTDK